VLVHGSMSLGDIVAGQQRTVWTVLLQPVGFVLYLIAACAETNRAPFDLPEAETDSSRATTPEYTGMRFALYFIAEDINMIMVSALAATLFLGGWSGPFWPGSHRLLLEGSSRVSCSCSCGSARRCRGSLRPADAAVVGQSAALGFLNVRDHGRRRGRPRG
jgi:NADH:ubiquinone oxidoreductase subunit H